MTSGEIVHWLIQQSDPANAALSVLIWWQLDRRIRQHHSQRLPPDEPGDGSGKGPKIAQQPEQEP